MNSYPKFLANKRQLDGNHGFDPLFVPDYLFDFQRDLVKWSVRKGRAAIFADCGMGKTIVELVYAQNIVERTNGNVMILTPLAVAPQTIAEAEKFDIEAMQSRTGKIQSKITVTNYEQLKKFDASDFVGVICDESSILKSFDGALRSDITVFMRKVPYRLLATATPSPNDYIELGTSSEALGYLGAVDMLNRFFKNDQNNTKVGRHRGQSLKWRFKGHAELPFWRWVCSWARALRKPSDLGYSDDNFRLPALHHQEHVIDSNYRSRTDLFAVIAQNLKEQREERRFTLKQRCGKVAEILNDSDDYGIAWCHLNDEGDTMERMIPDSIQVSGKDSNEAKEAKLSGFARGDHRVLVIKPKIGAWGLNFQHCAHMAFFPSHSYEQYYQGVRRCWRFGQKREVLVDIVTTPGESNVINNLRKKSEAAEKMFDRLVTEMNNPLVVNRAQSKKKTAKMPSWI